MTSRLEGVNGTLSARQAEIAGLVAAGKSTREIAETLFLSPRTVETHVQAIFEKLDVRTRVELTALVIRNAPVAQQPRKSRTLASLIGRDADVAAIRLLLETHRVVSIVGTGGLGKTQASLRVLEAMSASFADGAYVLELAPLARADHVLPALAQLLGISLSEDDPKESLTRQLRNKNALLLLDNCEHLIDEAGDIVAAITKSCDGVSVLTTSREALRISAERVYRLPTLTVPPGGSRDSCLRAADVAKYSAIELFAERARALDDRFAVTDAAVAAIGEICRRLDGVPLAIELAAARTNLFTPTQILAKIDDNLDLLQRASKDAPTRHQSMDALIDWSYDDLDEGERELFRELSIFIGSFALDGVVAIATPRADGESDLFEKLASLIDKSLVIVDRERETMRYRLLESTRLYARRKLSASGEHDAVAARHVRYLADRFSAMREDAGGWHPAGFYDAFAAQLGDIRLALDEAHARADYEPGGALLAAIGYYWFFLNLEREGLARNDAYVIALANHPLRFRLMPGLIDLTYKKGLLLAAAERAQQSLQDARKLGEPLALSIALNMVAACEERIDVIASCVAEIEGLACSYPELDIWFELRLSVIDGRALQLDRAEKRLRALLSQSLAAGDSAFAANIYDRLASVAYWRADMASAVSLSRCAVENIREFGNVKMLANMLHDLACYLCSADDLSGADAAATEALTIAVSIDPQIENVAVHVEGIAFARALAGDAAQAVLLSSFSRAALSRMGYGSSRKLLNELRSRVDVLGESLGESSLTALRMRGEQLSAQEAIELALA